MTEQDNNYIKINNKDFFKSIGLLSESVDKASASIYFEDSYIVKRPVVLNKAIKLKKKIPGSVKALPAIAIK